MRKFEGPVCDFCSGKNPRWEFQIPAGHEIGVDRIGNGDIHSMDEDGRWAACGPCTKLIMERDNSALAERSVDSFMKKHKIRNSARPEVLARVRQAHNFFFALWDSSYPLDREK
jgi:hypothetical protein